MFKKKFFILLILVFFQGCGFAPMYSSNQMIKIYTEEVIFDGDWELNNFIQTSLNRYTLKDTPVVLGDDAIKFQKFKITVNTDYVKTSATKDSTGKTTKYLFDIKVNINLISENLNKNFLYNEKFMMENFEDDLVEKNYETSNKKNIANLIINKFIIQYSNLK